jgi:uncharacterized repeat protein (TIGR03847 family)
MSKTELELKPVDHLTTDAIGKPGERVFYIQAAKGDQVVTLIVEKMQVQSLAVSADQFLAEISQKFPDLPEASSVHNENDMHIQPPVDPLFRVGEFGLGYDSDEDLIVLVAREILVDPPASGRVDPPASGRVEGQDAEETGVARLWCTRSQLLSMCRWGTEVVNRGRPICPQCGEPMDPAGHFCPKKNGNKH